VSLGEKAIVWRVFVDGENWVEIVWPGALPPFKARQQEAVLFSLVLSARRDNA
jgi:hypothetical protein